MYILSTFNSIKIYPTINSNRVLYTGLLRVLDKFSRLETLPLRCMLELLVCTNVEGVWLFVQIGVCVHNVHIWMSRIRDLITR